MAALIAADAPGLSPNIPSRGASNARIQVEIDGALIRLSAKNLAVGTYEVRLARRCPVAKAPAEVRTGRVPPRRSGGEPKPLPFESVALGELTVTDKTLVTTTTLDRPKRENLEVLMLKEDASASPSLSDRYGLVACGRLP